MKGCNDFVYTAVVYTYSNFIIINIIKLYVSRWIHNFTLKCLSVDLRSPWALVRGCETIPYPTFQSVKRDYIISTANNAYDFRRLVAMLSFVFKKYCMKYLYGPTEYYNLQCNNVVHVQLDITNKSDKISNARICIYIGILHVRYI